MRGHRTWILALAALLAASGAFAQNLFVNADLNDDPAGWELACGTLLTFTAVEDEAGCPASGSVHATSGPCVGFQGAGAGQCIAVVAQEPIFATGRVRGAAGFAGVAVRYHDTTDCTGTALLEENSPPAPATGDWQSVSYAGVPPAGSVSALLGFGVVNVAPVDADVDAGYAGSAPLVFRDGFDGDTDGGSSACRWSSVAP